MAFDFSYPNKSAQERGWGPGWTSQYPASGGPRPSSYPGTIVPVTVGNVTLIGGIRSELHELASLLLTTSLERGWIPKLDDPGCYGGAFRATKTSSGGYTTTASNHSFYTAVDINAPHNVYGSSTHQIPQAMADLWKQYGWRWLGPPINDWMHFDFAGTPEDAQRMLEKARLELGDQMTDNEKEQLTAAFQVTKAVEDFLAGKTLDQLPADAHLTRRQTVRALVRAASQPTPPAAVDLAAHTHAGGTTGPAVTAG